MAPELRPVATRFFPATRMGLVVGVIIAIVGALLWLRERDRIAAMPMPVITPADVGLPLRGPVVAHVWLENCADCMSAFDAHAQLHDAHALKGIPQVNVAYGNSTPAFAERYRVNVNLVVDADGSQVVKPFGIGSFTTLVLDKAGNVIHRDRPDHAGYADRVKEAWARALR